MRKTNGWINCQQALLTIAKWLLCGSVIGIVVGSTTSLLLTVNDVLGEVREGRSWIIFFLPVAGIIIGYLYMNYGKTIRNGSLHDAAELNNLVIDGIHGNKQVLRRMGPIVYAGTFLTVLFGGSTGREGAAIQMGGSVAEAVNKLFKITIENKKIFLMSGVAAGFGAAFGAPITGAIFGMEMAALGRLKFEAVMPCLVASFVGHYTVISLWEVEHETFIIQSVPDHSLITFIKVIAITILFSLVSVMYCQLRHGIQKTSESIWKKNHMKRAFWGGLIVVILTLIFGTDYNGRGLDILEQSFTDDVAPFAFLGKLIFTAITLGTGFVDGEAIPLFFMGATLGNTLHDIIHLPMSFMAGLGMIATFAGGANTPIAAFLLAMEMFDGKGVEYFFLACLVSYIISGHHGLWPSQRVFEPKSNLYQLKNGETIGTIEKKKPSET